MTNTARRARRQGGRRGGGASGMIAGRPAPLTGVSGGVAAGASSKLSRAIAVLSRLRSRGRPRHRRWDQSVAPIKHARPFGALIEIKADAAAKDQARSGYSLARASLLASQRPRSVISPVT